MTQRFNLSAVLEIPELAGYLGQVETCMQTTLDVEDTALTKAALRLTQAGGKRLRPALVLASYLLSGNKVGDSVIKAAAAIELIHIGSLVHDDIIDEASERWGRTTINAREGSDIAIISGDYLFAKACVLAAQVSQAAGILAAETIARLCLGQSAELETQNDLNRTETQLEKALANKTGALMAAACKLGGICADQPHDKLQALSAYGADFGMSFQLIDDVMDFISSEKLLGKPIGNDIKEGVYTLPIILSKPDKSGLKNHEALTVTLIMNGSIDKSIATAQQYEHSAEHRLTKAFGTKASPLARLPRTYSQWAFASLVAPRYSDRLST